MTLPMRTASPGNIYAAKIKKLARIGFEIIHQVSEVIKRCTHARMVIPR
jgi:hypothetical protein